MDTRKARTVVASLSALLALGCAVMAIAHAGVQLPLLSRLGPGGDNAVWPAVIAFTVAAVMLALVATGASRSLAWAWSLGLVVHALVVLGAAMPFRGAVSAVAIVVSLATVAVLLSRPGREALLPA